MNNPCITCGACCAFYRVSFYWAEAVPAELTVPISPYHSAMKGTECAPVRCCALEGKVGDPVSCSIYPRRPSACHQVMPSGHHGVRDEKCDKARLAHGLPILMPELSSCEETHADSATTL